MLRLDPTRTHYATYVYLRRLNMPIPKHEEVNAAWAEYTTARAAYLHLQNDETMIRLNGAYARFNRVTIEIDDAYGRRE